jgi:hypothetical protein
MTGWRRPRCRCGCGPGFLAIQGRPDERDPPVTGCAASTAGLGRVSARHRARAGQDPVAGPLLGGGAVDNPVGEWLFQALSVPCAAVGAVIAARRPANRVGWLLLVGALSLSSTQLAWTYVLSVAPDGGPASGLVGRLGNWLPWPAFGALIPLLLQFPDGRLLSRRWRPIAWAATAWCAATMLFMALYPQLIAYQHLQNPIGLTGRVGELMKGVQSSALAGIPLALALLAGLSLLLRFRRSQGAERQQLKWFAYVVALVIANIALSSTDRRLAVVSGVLHWPLIMGIAGAIGLAILRYRLYDIDRLINRTLVYGLLTAVLAGVYAAMVLFVGQLSGGIDAGSPSWAVAGATLAMAALFRPARGRIQAAVDRRFNRRKYNAATTIEAFSARLRDQIDLDTLTAELLAVTDKTMQPMTVSVWLRPPDEVSKAHAPRWDY